MKSEPEHIKSTDLCERCLFCRVLPDVCKTIKINTPCPYFKERTKND